MVVRLATEIEGITIKVAVPVVAPPIAFTIVETAIVKFLPPPASCVVTDGNVSVVAPAKIVAEPESVE